MSVLSTDEITRAAQQLSATKYYLCAGVTILLYDHLITFGDEVELVWKRIRSAVSFLFLVNRYYTPLAMTTIMIAFFSPRWTQESQDVTYSYWAPSLCPDTGNSCQHFVGFEPFGVAIPLLAIPGMLLILRIYALYGRNLYVMLYLSALLLVQIAVGIWEFSFPGWGPTRLLPFNVEAFHGCLYAPSPKLGQTAGSFLVLEVVFDVSVFFLIMLRTWRSFWFDRSSSLFRRISQDGVLYFVVIFSANCAWLFMVLFAPLGIKYMNAHPAVILIITMINRLTINLRADAGRDRHVNIGTISDWGSRYDAGSTSLSTWSPRNVNTEMTTAGGVTIVEEALEDGAACETWRLRSQD